MKLGTKMVTEQALGFTFTRRSLVLDWAQGGIAALLIGRMAWLSIAENDRYLSLAESNRIELTMIPPRRGWIVDRLGKPIAINRTDFRVDLIPSKVKNPEFVLHELRKILALPEEEVRRIRAELADNRSFRPIQVASDLSYEAYAAVSLRVPDLPGTAPSSGTTRYYPAGAAVAHLVGYVGTASAKDYEKTKDPLLIAPGFKVGKEGIERALESWLRGTAGAKRAEVTAHGKLVRELTTRPDTPGKTLQLTIDIGLQQYAARRLGTQSGSIVVIDTNTGGILAMVSMPAYDPNSFSGGISHSEWNMLSANDHLPLTNKVLQGLYPPASTVKPMVALALLQAGIDPARQVSCSGRYQVGSGYFHCWKRRGHGPVDMHMAVAQSCDIYFYAMAREAGIDAIAPVARSLGLGERFPLPFPSQRFGTVPDAEWKLKKYNEQWKVADTVNATIGQGYMLANPLQLAVMAARIATGQMLDPRIIVNQRHSSRDANLGFNQRHLELVRASMLEVVGPLGTANAARLPIDGIALAGKTGTAQVRRITMAERRRGVLSNSALPYRLRDHSLFMGYAPYGAPRYAIGVILEHSGHMVTAAPIARDVITWLYEPKKAMATLNALEKSWGGDIETRMRAEEAAWLSAQAGEG